MRFALDHGETGRARADDKDGAVATIESAHVSRIGVGIDHHGRKGVRLGENEVAVGFLGRAREAKAGVDAFQVVPFSPALAVASWHAFITSAKAAAPVRALAGPPPPSPRIRPDESLSRARHLVAPPSTPIKRGCPIRLPAACRAWNSIGLQQSQPEAGGPDQTMSTTETIDPRNVGLDTWSDERILDAMIDGQRRAVAAVERARPALAAAAAAVAARVARAGRIVYAGAGSSGVIAALDGIELLGTFGWPEDRVAFVLASGERLAPITGGEEDDEAAARDAIAALALTPSDAVIAVAASGTTPFTLAAVDAAVASGSLTVGIANNAGTPLLEAVDVPVLLESGPEVIVGSTRMGAGTAQKAAFNLISTLVMIHLGHIYDGLMVGLRADNKKLRARAIRTLRSITGCSDGEAAVALLKCGGNVKPAALVLRGIAPAEGERLLSEAGGNLRMALTRLG